MNLPHELEKLRDELAEKYTTYSTTKREAFSAGFTACFQALSEAAGEWSPEHDDLVRKNAITRTGNHISGQIFWAEGARWQFESDRARIALETLKRNEAVEFSSKLKARLAESERERATYNHAEGMLSYNGEPWVTLKSYSELRFKLSASESDNARLRAALESIAKNSCCEPCREAGLVARKALNQESLSMFTVAGNPEDTHRGET